MGADAAIAPSTLEGCCAASNVQLCNPNIWTQQQNYKAAATTTTTTKTKTTTQPKHTLTRNHAESMPPYDPPNDTTGHAAQLYDACAMR